MEGSQEKQSVEQNNAERVKFIIPEERAPEAVEQPNNLENTDEQSSIDLEQRLDSELKDIQVRDQNGTEYTGDEVKQIYEELITIGQELGNSKDPFSRGRIEHFRERGRLQTLQELQRKFLDRKSEIEAKEQAQFSKAREEKDKAYQTAESPQAGSGKIPESKPEELTPVQKDKFAAIYSAPKMTFGDRVRNFFGL